MHNVAVEPFKLHPSPSGCPIFHNTMVKHGPPSVLWTPERVRDCRARNTRFAGTAADYAYDCTAPRVDDDGFAGGPFRRFLR
ncbi:MAG TPA: hypothetical protein VFF52_20230 [Isosphaeraceae bacterium]|nr:hypothetical protein [Isosphaeraceae bacterium]